MQKHKYQGKEVTGSCLGSWWPQAAHREGAERLKADIERQIKDIQHSPQEAILSLSNDHITSYPQS